MTFADPTLLWLLLLAPACAAAAAGLWRRRRRADAAWASRGLWPRLRPPASRLRLAASVATLALAVLGASLALARPRWGTSEHKVQRRGVDVVFVIDSSLSMGALDVAPSRMAVAKTLVRRLVAAMPGNRVGLVQTEGAGQVLAPLTLDGAVVDLLLDAIEPGSLPTPGTSLGSGIEAALRLFGTDSKKHRVLVVLSDGEDHAGGLAPWAARLRREGVAAFAFGVGTPDGAPVVIPGRADFKRTADGSVVITRLNEETLESLARETGGRYQRATSAAAEITDVTQRIGAIETRTFESQVVSTREERFQWPLAAAVLALTLHLAWGPFRSAGRQQAAPAPAAAAAPRRRSAATLRLSLVPLALALVFPELPSWLPWKPGLPLWAERILYNPRERTTRALELAEQGKPEAALKLARTALRLAAEDPRAQYNAGTAEIAAGRPRRAAELLAAAAEAAPGELAPAAHFNLGNARLAHGDAAGAVEAYRGVLRADPGHQAAKHNLEIALARREEERLRLRGQREGPRGDRPGDTEPSDQGGGQDPEESEGSRSKSQNPAPTSKPGTERAAGRADAAGHPDDTKGPVPRFRNQPEMNAREAAAVLAAVENLERQRRRDQAVRNSRQRAAGEKDW